MASSKFAQRRGVHKTPRICHHTRKNPPPPPSGCECFFSPDELWATAWSYYSMDLYGCCGSQGEVTADVTYSATGGEWDDTELSLENCGALTPNGWTAPGEGGDYTLTAEIAWPDGTHCTAQMTAHVEGEP